METFETPGETPRAPEAGDFSLCLRCSAVLCFDEARRLRLATVEERMELANSHPRIYLQLMKAQRLIRQQQARAQLGGGGVIPRTGGTGMRMPDFYIPPLGGPLNWFDEQTGVLVEAVHRYLEGQPPPTDEQLALVVEYCVYYVNAPCWEDGDGRLAKLRERAPGLRTVAEIDRWLRECNEIGLLPVP